ncbi:DUF1738 domain-containing protein [Acidithiobacillus sp. CV18-2]|nr:DUF1738 domain-containing protein [Acidithiobacillus sp. CV18-3]MBU2756004.1 DUF1738 domain-containing protein [Acidithiobacillus sp. BN09-2]MBU2777247.1 DUF1738 domain-containing protein [Acidithiobacillus sp. CV18-2]MBU2799903.1 DUF1738 domain-containing protein [Acidithiobacillus sp. VAN18-4]
MASRGKEEKRDFRLDVADRLIHQMEQGTARWQKPWKSGEVQVPVNAVTGKPYRGVNRETLMMFSPDASDPRWCTYKQAQEKGWQVCKGASGLPLEVWKEYEHKLTEEEIRRLEEQGATDIEPTEKRLGVRYYTVFHASQIDGIPPLERPDITHEVDGKPDERLPKLAEAMGVSLGYGGGAAFYHSSTDHVQMPPIETFEKAAGHDTTLLHELSHATGHESRLSRKLGNPFGSPEYAVEELRAEMSAAMTAASLGLGFDPAAQDVEQDREAGNSAAYLAGWLKALPEKERKQTIMQVIKDAQSISDYLIERTPELEQAVEVDRDPGISVGEREVATLSRGDYVRYNDELGREQEALIFDAEDGGQPNRYRIFPILRLYREDGSSLSIPGISDEPRIVSIPESVLKQHIPGVISPEAMDAIDPFTETYKRNMSDELQNPVEREVLLTVEAALQVAPEKSERTLDAELIAHLEKRNQIRQGEGTELPAAGDDWPGRLPTGLGGDRIENAENFIRITAMRNPEQAEQWAAELRGNPRGYAERLGLKADNIERIARQMEQGVQRIDIVSASPARSDLSDSVGAAGRLAKSLEVLEQHSLTLPRPDGTHKTVNARRYLDEGIARGFTQADTTANPLAWINPETQKRLTVRDDALAATLRAAQAVDTHVGRAIQSVARQKTDLEWEM